MLRSAAVMRLAGLVVGTLRVLLAELKSSLSKDDFSPTAGI